MTAGWRPCLAAASEPGQVLTAGVAASEAVQAPRHPSLAAVTERSTRQSGTRCSGVPVLGAGRRHTCAVVSLVQQTQEHGGRSKRRCNKSSSSTSPTPSPVSAPSAHRLGTSNSPKQKEGYIFGASSWVGIYISEGRAHPSLKPVTSRRILPYITHALAGIHKPRPLSCLLLSRSIQSLHSHPTYPRTL